MFTLRHIVVFACLAEHTAYSLPLLLSKIKDEGLRYKELNDPEVIRPQDHLDAVKLEADGHLNKDYRKEILLGNHEEFDKFSEKEQEQVLREIFARVDTDRNDKLNLLELEEWIITKVDEHFDEAKRENEMVFKNIDTNSDGYITWEEFLMQYLKLKGNTDEDARELARTNMAKLKMRLTSKDNERVIQSKFRWVEADENGDNNLTLDEFKNFRHPEGSRRSMHNVVKDILENLDTVNHDGQLSEEEFVRLPDGDLNGQFDTDEWRKSDNRWVEERRSEFRVVIDTNRDGIVSRDELLNYVNPHNPNHARNEAKNLIQLADQNSDMQLSIDEVLRNKAIFMGSKMVNPAKNFHNEL